MTILTNSQNMYAKIFSIWVDQKGITTGIRVEQIYNTAKEETSL